VRAADHGRGQLRHPGPDLYKHLVREAVANYIPLSHVISMSHVTDEFFISTTL